MIIQPAVIGDTPPPGPVPPPAQAPLSFSLEGQVQNALNLWLPLKSRAQMPALLAALSAEQDKVHKALAQLHYVHFARFMPSPDGSILWVITEYDGGLQSYVMDFVAVLGDVFTAILQFVQGAPRLPVQRFPRDFVKFIDTHDLAIEAWSAYPDMTVIDILQEGRGA